MATRTEQAPTTRANIPLAERRQLLATIDRFTTAEKLVTHLGGYVRPRQEVRAEADYLLLPRMAGLLEAPDISDQQREHLALMVALGIKQLSETPPASIRRVEQFVEAVGEIIPDQLAGAIELPDDLKGLSGPWKTALTDYRKAQSQLTGRA